jgi:hypothetical protein
MQYYDNNSVFIQKNCIVHLPPFQIQFELLDQQSIKE